MFRIYSLRVSAHREVHAYPGACGAGSRWPFGGDTGPSSGGRPKSSLSTPPHTPWGAARREHRPLKRRSARTQRFWGPEGSGPGGRRSEPFKHLRAGGRVARLYSAVRPTSRRRDWRQGPSAPCLAAPVPAGNFARAAFSSSSLPAAPSGPHSRSGAPPCRGSVGRLSGLAWRLSRNYCRRRRSASAVQGSLQMDLTYSDKHKALQAEVRAFIAQHGHRSPSLSGGRRRPSRQLLDWQKLLLEHGYFGRTIPQAVWRLRRRAGRGRTPRSSPRSSARPASIPACMNQGISMLVPTLLEVGTEEQRQRWIGPTIRGEIIWCQGYSEPGSGSDLASLRTRADLTDGHWVVNGQKIWTSSAHLRRHDVPAVPHRAGRSRSTRASPTCCCRWTRRASRCGR